MKFLDIGELARRTGTAASALRYYDDIGLVPSIARRGLRRQFGPEAELQVALIQLCKQAGFTLAEIATILAGVDGRGLPRATLRARAEGIEAQIRELERMRDLLLHVADCRAPSHLECPTFRRILRRGIEGQAAPG